MKKLLNLVKKQPAVAVVIMLAIMILLYVILPVTISGSKNEALVLGVGGPFGGQVKKIDYICTGGIAFTLGLPSPGLYFYPTGARTYLFGPPATVGKWTVGLASRGGVCTVGYKTYPTQYTVIMIGTSFR